MNSDVTFAAGSNPEARVELVKNVEGNLATVRDPELRRQLRALSALGRLEDRSWGVVVPDTLFDSPSARTMIERIDRDATRMVRRLRNVGAIVQA